MRVKFDPSLSPSTGSAEAAPQARAAAPPPEALRAARAARARAVAPERTPLSQGEIREALGAAYERTTGRRASDATLDVLTAHVSLETARGQRMFNYNFGGIKGASPEGATARYQTHEVFHGKRVKLEQPFRAYATAESGAADYLNLLRRRFPDAVAAADAGDARGFADRLGRAGYFTAPPSEYAAALERLAAAAGEPGRDARVAHHARPRPELLGAPPAGDAFAAPAVSALNGAELELVLDAISVAGAARIASPDQEPA